MADQPFNYTLPGAVNPVDAMFSGMQFGQQQRAGEQQMALSNSQEQRAQTQFGQQNIQFDQAQQDRATALKAAMEAKAQAQKMQQDLAGLAAKVGSGAATSGDFTAMAAMYPDLTDEMAKMWEGQTAERKAADTANVYKAAAAIKAGKPEIALDMLEERAKAAEAGGDQQEADISRALAAGIKADPSAGLATLGLLLHAVDEKASVELFGEPKASELPADVRSIQWRAEQAGLKPGTPEYQDFVAQTGGNDQGKPASFRALELQAQSAGLVPGSDDYKKFMRTKGAGDVAQAKDESSNLVEARASLPDILAKSQAALDLIDAISTNPALPSITGNIQGNMAAGIPFVSGGQAGTDLNAKIDQLKGKAFLEAFTSLKGGGAISEIEGEKATSAIAALSRNQSPEAYRAALADLKAVIEGAMERAKSKADGSGSPQTAPAPASIEDDLAKYGAPAP